MSERNGGASIRRAGRFQLLDGGRVGGQADEDRRRDLELHLGALIFELDAQGCFQYLSSSAWRLIGLDARQAIGKSMRELFFELPLDHRETLIVRDFEARKPIQRFTFRPAYDPTRRIEISLKPIEDESGQYGGWRGVVAACDRADVPDATPMAASYRLLGLMSEALLHRAQDLLMAAQGALELLCDNANDSEPARVAHTSISECLSLQTAFVGFCRSHLLDNSLCLVSPILAKAASRAALQRGASLAEFVVVQQDDLLVFADAEGLCDEICNWLTTVVPRQIGEVEAIFVYPTIITNGSGGTPREDIDCRRLALTAIHQNGTRQAHNTPAQVLQTAYAAFSPGEAIRAMNEKDAECE
jgi:PAS domain S-box-containing protein